MNLIGGLRSAAVSSSAGLSCRTRLSISCPKYALLLSRTSPHCSARSISSSPAVSYARPSPLLYYSPRWVNGKHPHEPPTSVNETEPQEDEALLDGSENDNRSSSESEPPSSSSGDDPSDNNN